ncbi:MAG: ATP synthase F0 subunit B [Coriobacteriia bacterium]|nr:ATP synthase F0 subunit B [Coriobacteriia bacterium]
MELLSELVSEFLHELTTTEYLIELVQGSLLILILVLALPRLLKPRLAARRQGIIDDLEAAVAAPEEVERAEKEAKAVVARVRREAHRTKLAAKADAIAERDEAISDAEREAAEIVEHAHQTVEAEKASVSTETCEEMVGLVTVIARRFLDESLSEKERRALTERVVMSSLENIDSLHVE